VRGRAMDECADRFLFRNEQLNIKVKDADGNEVFFKVKKHTRLAKLKRAYAEKMGKSENTVRFITSDGNRVGDEDTAETVSCKYSLRSIRIDSDT
jgi:hypothetical protein